MKVAMGHTLNKKCQFFMNRTCQFGDIVNYHTKPEKEMSNASHMQSVLSFLSVASHTLKYVYFKTDLMIDCLASLSKQPFFRKHSKHQQFPTVPQSQIILNISSMNIRRSLRINKKRKSFKKKFKVFGVNPFRLSSKLDCYNTNLSDMKIHCVSVYGPQLYHSSERKSIFWSQLSLEVEKAEAMGAGLII